MNTREMPPLNPLHVFNVAASAGSFAQAAIQLNVTQSAVSRQIATLEASLGVRLFERERRGLSLTPAGEMYRKDIAPAFDIIAAATLRVKRDVLLEPLRIAIYPTFAVKWLIKRLPDFEARFPGVAVQMTSITAPVTFSRDDVDVSVQLGTSPGEDADGVQLFADVMQPVCSPKLLERGTIGSLDDLRNHRMLHSKGRPRDWTDWLHAQGRTDLLRDQTSIYPSSLLAYEAASNGIGVAIGQIPLLSEDIRDEILIPLFDPLDTGRAYYAAWPKSREPGRKVRVFVSWLRRSIAESFGNGNNR